jgi:hypothetical protein
VYDNRIEYVQAKTTDNDRKWSVKEFSEGTTRNVPPTGRQRKDQLVSNNDSILHKSLACDKTNLPGYFRILSSRDVIKDLQFLKINFATRSTKDGRAKLLKSLKSKLKTFKSPNGNDVEYWLDHAIWQVIPTPNELKLASISQILKAAQHQGIYLNANGDAERILCSILYTLTNKSGMSRVLYSADDKTYNREDFIQWFNDEIEHYAVQGNNHVKIYSTGKNNLTAILSKLFREDSLYAAQTFDGDKICTGLHGNYHRKEYCYNNIAKSIHNWLPEILLLPNELADNSPENLENKMAIYTKSKRKQLNSLNELIAKVLLHSTIRTEFKSQPIPASLYIDDAMGTCFDNVHIILETHSPDSLLLGYSHFIEGEPDAAIDLIIKEFDDLLGSESFDTQRDKILEIKEDTYLLKHDIDDILRSNTSLDEHINRFRFVFFLGYESDSLECSNLNMPPDYKIKLQEEVTNKFSTLIDRLIEESDYYKDLHVDVYIYPVPSIVSLINAVKSLVEL